MAPTPKKLFHVQGIFDASVLHEIMTLADGRSYDLKVTAVKADFDESGEPKERKSMRAWFIEYLINHPQFKTLDAKHAAQEAGYAAESIYGVINAAYKDGVLKRLDERGSYGVAQPKANGAMNGVNGHKVPREQITGRQIVIDTIAAGKNTMADFRAAFVAHGRSPKSVNDQVGKLKDDKTIKALGRGTYELRAAN